MTVPLGVCKNLLAGVAVSLCCVETMWAGWVAGLITVRLETRCWVNKRGFYVPEPLCIQRQERMIKGHTEKMSTAEDRESESSCRHGGIYKEDPEMNFKMVQICLVVKYQGTGPREKRKSTQFAHVHMPMIGTDVRSSYNDSL